MEWLGFGCESALQPFAAAARPGSLGESLMEEMDRRSHVTEEWEEGRPPRKSSPEWWLITFTALVIVLVVILKFG